ncbi:MAG: TonB-dependent receptor [Bacteroidales bacterium]|nr:TonB-dependent receptor [Bacteroidales bacterium]
MKQIKDFFKDFFLLHVFKRRLTYLMLWIGAVSCGFNNVAGQDTVMLMPVNIISERLNDNANSINISKIDSFTLSNKIHKNLGDILQSQSGIQIRTYGYGGISTLAMRTGNSYQTALLWNGFNLQDPLNGGVNLIALPSFFVDKLEMHKGGETSLFGSGAMGGSVFMNSGVALNQGHKLLVVGSFGSFESITGGVAFTTSKKHWASKTRLFYKNAKNDFPYIDRTSREESIKYQRNAAVEQLGIMQQNTMKTGKKSLLTVDLWALNSDNQVPATVYQTSEIFSTNLTKNLRGALTYSVYRNRLSLKMRHATIFNSLTYNDKLADLNYTHQSFSQISEVESKLQFNQNHHLLFGINNTNDRGISESLSPEAKQNRTALFLAYKWLIKNRLNLILNSRKEFVKSSEIPLTYSLKAGYKIAKPISLFASISKNYRLPTFNDLFWIDYFSQGNPNLKPEWGNSQEFGLTYSKKWQCSALSAKANYFQSRTNDLIQWIPVNNIWIPKNIQQVKNKGMEMNMDYKICFSKQHFVTLSLDYTFLKSVAINNSVPSEETENKQLIFVPKHKGGVNMKWFFGKYFIAYQQTFIDKVFTTSDHLDYLRGYSLADVVVGRNFVVNKNSFTLSFSVLNIWNTEYQTMPAYAMPGINYDLTIKYLLQSTKHE